MTIKPLGDKVVIKMIETELKKYNDFYISLIETFEGQEILSLSSNNANIASNKIKRVYKKQESQ